MLRDLFTYITQPNKRACRKVVSFGGKAMARVDLAAVLDGNKAACMDPELGLPSAAPCLVYSLGINDEWSFDWDMEAFGCNVFAFDPSMNATAGDQNGTISFARYGVGGEDGRHPRHPDWQMRTLDTLADEMGHAQSTIHYLKMDVEGSEWEVLQQQVARGRDSLLFRSVEQLGAELHFYPRSDTAPAEQHVRFHRQVYASFLGLQEMGFYPFSYEANPSQESDVVIPGLDRKITPAMEVVWLKTRCVDNAGGDSKRDRSPGLRFVW
ncbi:uncharacterized protein LOC119114871 [Pollicipes pollicipes]|uniref:uncharacterized protein LOC119114871 n=1 Tax=Pollicipes pollicipes TaxID=41117 RepID=UPI001884A156|nr:uncharacterized protein LOC119114871 [Pollicipes pollicipes]